MTNLILVLDTARIKKCPYMEEIRGHTSTGEKVFNCCKVVNILCDGVLADRPVFCPLVEPK